MWALVRFAMSKVVNMSVPLGPRLDLLQGSRMPNFLSKLLSIGSDKDLKEFERITAQVNELEPRFMAMSEEELRGITATFRERYAQGESLDDLLPEAFAAVR